MLRFIAAPLLVLGLFEVLLSAQALATDDFLTIPLSPPYIAETYGSPTFFTAQESAKAKIITPGRKHLEIDKSTQGLKAYDETGQLALEAPVSTGNPGIDEKGRQREETHPGIHRIFEVKPFRRWSKDPKVKMLNWIGMLPGVEKGIHSLEPVGEFAHYEKFLGQKTSHGCIRLSRKNSHWLVKWIGEEWKAYPFIVYIYEKSLPPQAPRPERPYLLMLVLREGAYLASPVSHEPVPSVERSETALGQAMKPGDFFLYRKEPDGWHLVRSSHPTTTPPGPGE